jgi:ribose transport system permease protein
MKRGSPLVDDSRVAGSSPAGSEPPDPAQPDPAGWSFGGKRVAGLRGRAGDTAHTLGIVIALLALGVLFTILQPRFGSLYNIGNIVSQSSILGIMATGMTFAIVSGEIDLSVGSTFALCAIAFALFLQAGWNVYLAIVAAVALGAAAGLCNGILSVLFSVPSIIITLGTLNVYSGLALYISKGLPISNFRTTGPLFSFGQNTVPGPAFVSWIPQLAIAWLVVGMIGYWVLHSTAFGMRVYATGSNRQAAVNAGISDVRVRLQVLALVGGSAGLAGVLSVGQYGSASPGAGATYNLTVIAAVIIGGAALYGGHGSVLASAIGVLILGEVNNGLIIAGANLYGQVIAQGALVVLAVAIDRLSHGNAWYFAAARRRLRSLSAALGRAPEIRSVPKRY